MSFFFHSSTLSDERCSNLSFEGPNQNLKNRTLNCHRDTGGTAACTMGGDDVWPLTSLEPGPTWLLIVLGRQERAWGPVKIGLPFNKPGLQYTQETGAKPRELKPKSVYKACGFVYKIFLPA